MAQRDERFWSSSRADLIVVAVALLGVSMWAFGNLYEAIVVTPNLLVDPVAKAQAWREHFSLTSPAYFHLHVPLLGAVAALMLAWHLRRTVLRRSALTAGALIVLALALSGYIIGAINLRLFYGDLAMIAPALPAMPWQWNVLNAIRVLLLASGVAALLRTMLGLLASASNPHRR